MDKVYLGKIVNTHGIKGELRIKSDFEKKELAFKVGKSIWIGNSVHKIRTYRVHKDYDMVTIDDFDNINQVEYLKGAKVYIERNELDLSSEDYLLEDLLSMRIICNDKEYGIVNDYSNDVNPLLEIINNDKKYYIPIRGKYIINVDMGSNKIYCDSIEELML